MDQITVHRLLTGTSGTPSVEHMGSEALFNPNYANISFRGIFVNNTPNIFYSSYYA
jgi:hypothetical protein